LYDTNLFTSMGCPTGLGILFSKLIKKEKQYLAELPCYTD